MILENKETLDPRGPRGPKKPIGPKGPKGPRIQFQMINYRALYSFFNQSLKHDQEKVFQKKKNDM